MVTNTDAFSPEAQLAGTMFISNISNLLSFHHLQIPLLYDSSTNSITLGRGIFANKAGGNSFSAS
jgi:hypothetical protein